MTDIIITFGWIGWLSQYTLKALSSMMICGQDTVQLFINVPQNLLSMIYRVFLKAVVVILNKYLLSSIELAFLSEVLSG